MRTRLRDDRGAAALEFALVLPLLVALAFGVIEFGNFYSAQLAVTNAARVAVRDLAVGRTATQAQTDGTNAAGAIPDTSSLTFSGVVACPTDGTVVARTVTVTYPLTGITKLFFTTLTVKGTGAMLCNS